MVERPRTEPIEIDVEELSFVPGHSVDLLGAARRWWDASPAAVTAPAVRRGAAPTVTGTPGLAAGATFWRVIDVPGSHLASALGAWWRWANHDGGRLRLGGPRPADGAWQLGGTLRVVSRTRRLAVDLRLSAYAHYWTYLELTPRRPIRPNRLYFRIGHDALDVFVATLRAADATVG